LLGGLIIGVASGITTAFYPAASEVVIYLIMGVMLIVRPRGLFGQEGLFE
jgi:branched-chain amino acid transport system permease protein